MQKLQISINYKDVSTIKKQNENKLFCQKIQTLKLSRAKLIKLLY